MRKGKRDFLELFESKSEWEKLENIRKIYPAKRVMDRRFHGPKHRRTRDYDSDEFN